MSEDPKKEETPPAASPAPARTHFLEKPAIRGLLTAMALASPVPLMLTMIDLWLGCCAPAEMKEANAIELFKRTLDGAGGAPAWLLPIAFMLPVILLSVMHRRSMPALLAVMLALVAATAGELFLLTNITQG